LVEAGKLEGPETEEILWGYLEPMLAAGIDALVLGCTHYPFLRPAIQRVVGPGVRIIDPSPAVARQAGRVLSRHGLHTPLPRLGHHIFYTTGDPVAFERMVRRLIGGQPQVRSAHRQRGRGGRTPGRIAEWGPVGSGDISGPRAAGYQHCFFVAATCRRARMIVQLMM